jgi:RimJ/RimL family protein N-acetyltransferase
MLLARTGYVPQFEDVASGDPDLGSAAIIPWDTAIFGFPVARYRPALPAPEPDSAARLDRVFRRWSDEHAVALWLCDVPVTNPFWRTRLAELGFHMVDFALRTTLLNLQHSSIPEARAELRAAVPTDHEAIEQIAGGAFHHGRYHADPIFPRRLADRRYRVWMKNVLEQPESTDKVYVLIHLGEVKGFYHINLDGGTADLRLAAVAPELQGTLLGLDLYSSMMSALKGLGIKRVITSISAANTAVLNVYSMLGFRFSAPELLFHRHSPDLVPVEP